MRGNRARLRTIAFVPERPDGARLHRRPHDRADSRRPARERTIGFVRI
jgi:hypothetical protein